MNIKKLIPLFFLLALLGLFFYFRLYQYLSFTALKDNRATLSAWTQSHFLLASIIYMASYALAVAVSIPGATLLTLTGGFLFGIALGSIYIIFSATLGASLIFLATKTAFANTLRKKAGPFVKKLEAGFQKDAFNYLLVLRLIPLFPFWLINIVPALLNMRFKSYVLATALGIIPGTIVYVAIGNGLGSLFDNNQTPNLGIIFQPQILLPIIGLAVLAIVPVIYKRFKRN
jgi:uncharacterized membrane protein YdjX (TVP38/TMEM64 family)